MTGNLKIFLSSTCNDLFQERRDIAQALIDAGHSVIVSELPTRMPVNPNLSCIENCLEAIRKHCDLLVLVIASRYGSSDEEGKSVTLQEYLRARELSLPIITFVRKSVLDLVPIYRKNPETNFEPIVFDNRVLEFVVKIMEEPKGNWVFGFDDAESITDLLAYQLSCLLRDQLLSRAPVQSEPTYKNVANTTYLLERNGRCVRTLDYVVRNDTAFEIERLYGGDRSDVSMSFSDMELKVFDEEGTEMCWEKLEETPEFRRWDIVLSKPLRPGEEIRFSTWFNSYDRYQMQTWVNKLVEDGLIKCLMPSEFVEKSIEVAIRDSSGWRDNPKEAKILSVGGLTIVLCPFRSRAGFFQFRARWGCD